MNVLVIGAGPAGMLAAATAANNGHAVTMLEQNEKLGKKLFITGKGRCNLTNDCDRDVFFLNIPRNPKFLFSAYAACNPQDVMTLFEELGVPLKVERGNRVFPQSDKSSDIIRAMDRYLKRTGVLVRFNTKVDGLLVTEGRIAGVRLSSGETLPANSVILASGGASYPATGSRGDGYRFLSALGHSILPPRPALVPLETKENWPGTLSGLTLKNVRLKAVQKGNVVFEELGELLFAHFGVTGPLILSASSRIADAPEGTSLFIDLKPGLIPEQLERRLMRDLDAAKQKTVKNAFSGLLPARLLPVVLEIAGIEQEQPAAAFTKQQRKALVSALKALPLTVAATRPLTEAIITRGGVNTREVKPGTMESKLVSGLYICGEALDVDGYTGGFNLQIAWSTGYLAGLLQ